MHQLWRVRADDGDGKELYGEDYADIYAISRLHFKAASNGTCDHVRSRVRNVAHCFQYVKMLCFLPIVRRTVYAIVTAHTWYLVHPCSVKAIRLLEVLMTTYC